MKIESILAGKGREVKTIQPDALVGEAVRRMREERIGALVVIGETGRISGIVSDRGILWGLAERGTGILDEPIASLMTMAVFTCRAEDEVSAMMAAMTQRRIRHIPVVDGDGNLVGIVSIGDVVKQRLDQIQAEADAMRDYISGTV
jgi:CBS domain-containing protein